MTSSERYILSLSGARIIEDRPRAMIARVSAIGQHLKIKHGFTDKHLIGLVIDDDGGVVLGDRTGAIATQFATVQRIDLEHPHLLRWNSDRSNVEFLQHANRAIAGSGLLSKSGAEHSVILPNGQQVATDVIAFPDGNRIDIIQGSGAHPIPGGPAWIVIPPELWRPSNRYIDVTGWEIFPGDAPTTTVPARRARLGRGWFCILRAFQDWPQEAIENWRAILGEEDPDLFRAIFDCEGIKHIPRDSGMPDVWRDAGCSYRDPWWRDRVRATLNRMGEYGKQLVITLYGGRERFRTRDEMRRYHDALVSASEGLYGAIYGFIIANEWSVNGFTAPEIQFCGRDLRSKIPSGTRLALSSPNLAHEDSNATTEMMTDSFIELYGPPSSDHFGATFADVHRVRDFASRWFSQYSYNGIYPIELADSEPPGQGASSGGNVTEASRILGDYTNADRAAWIYWLAFNAWSVWNGHMPREWIEWLRARQGDAYAEMHAERMFLNMPNQRAISNGVRTYRQSGTIEPGGGEEMPLPGREEMRDELNALHEYYKSRDGLQRDRGLWIREANGDEHPDFEGIAAWLLDVYQNARVKGKSREFARQLWKANIERSDEWRQKHPGQAPTPMPT